MSWRRLRGIVPVIMLCSLAACDRLRPRAPDRTLPEVEVVAQLFEQHGIDARYQYSGNVLEVVVQQPPGQLQRGGELWARVGPYIYLFSPATRELFDEYAGVAGVRVITRANRSEVARAMLVRDTLNDYSWRRALGALSQALEEGTSRPNTLERLVQIGEEYAQFQYNPRYVPPRPGVR